MDPSNQTSSQATVRDLPLYGQHSNACGLASLLMLLDIPHNPEIGRFLDTVWNHIKPLYSQPVVKKKEYQWAIALQYILLKILGYADKEDLYEFFNQRLEFMYEDQRIMNKFNQEQYYNELLKRKKYLEAYTYLHYTEDHDYVLPFILFKNLHTMKTDLELKILAEVFNYTFIYQDAEDYTGALYFTNQELGREISQSARVKWNRLEKFSRQPDVIILYGQQHHWLAVRGVYKLQAKDNIPEEVMEVLQDNGNKFKKTSTISDISEIFSTSPNSNSSDSNLSDSSSSDSNSSKSSSRTRNGKDKSILAEISAIFDDEFNTWHPRRLIVDMNDPATVSQVQFSYKSLNESDRFYIFRKRSEKEYSAFKLLLKYLKDDCLAEQVRWNDFLDKRAESAKNATNSKAPNSENKKEESKNNKE
ncbi:MAG: hypothetical protein DRO88_05245 [Promethearchaeia archaeon]|nr:MAG: hypothetical protein DRO88_05245 [Candidatus Lokiarchaeia archaeon]